MRTPLWPTTLHYGAPVNWAHPWTWGLKAWWKVLPLRMGGLTWLDLVGTAHGTFTGIGPSTEVGGWGGTQRPGGFGEVRFDGSSDYVQVAHSPAVDFGGAMPQWTVMFWVKHLAAPSFQMILTKDTDNGGSVCPVEIRATSATWQVIANGGAIAAASTTTMATKIWYHLAVVRTTQPSTSTAIAVNGVVEDTRAGSTFSANTRPLYFGRRDDSPTSNLTNGCLDDIRLWNRPLSAAEILTHYHDSRRPLSALLQVLGGPGLNRPAPLATVPQHNLFTRLVAVAQASYR